jgi:hypothetical protein
MRLVIYLTKKNLRVIMHIIYGYGIKCEFHPFSCTRMHSLINEEQIHGEFRNMQDVLKNYVLDFYSPLANDLNWGIISHEDGKIHA